MTLGMVESGRKVESTIEFSPFIKALKKHWWKILLFTVVVTGACYPLVARMSAHYVSTATVLIKAQEDNATPLEKVDGYDSTRAPYYLTQFNLMQSRVVLEKAILDLKLHEDPRYNGQIEMTDSIKELPLSEPQRIAATLKTLNKHLSFSEVRLTQLVHITYESEDAEEAARIANGVAQAFIDYTIDQKVEKVKAAQQWNQKQMEELKNQVAAKKKEMETFLNEAGLITYRGIDGFETQQMSIASERLANATERRMLAQSQYELVVRNLDAPLEDVASIPAISSHPQLQDLRIAMIQAKRLLFELQNRYGPRHNKILEAKAQIDAIQAQSRQLLEELKVGLYKEYQTQLSKENRYKALLQSQKNDFKSMVAKRDKYESMKTDLDKTEELYKQLFERSKEQNLTLTYREPDAVVYDPASVAKRPQKPNKPLLLVMVCILSFCLSTLYVIIRTAMDRKIYSLEQVPNKLGLTPLADLPELVQHGEYSRGELSALIRANKQAFETFHGIKTAIELAAPSTHSLGVVASGEKEGASLVAQLVAESLNLNHKTLLIDLDYRSEASLSSSVVGENGSQEPLGAAQWNSDSAHSLIVQLDGQCDFLPRGQLEQSPLVFFSGEAFSNMMSELKQRYARVVVNLPCLSDNKDAQLAAQAVDGVVVVVNAESRSSSDVRKDVNKLVHPEITTIGAVLNRVKDENLQSEESKQFISQGEFSVLLTEG